MMPADVHALLRSPSRPGPGERTLHVRERQRKSDARAARWRSVFGERSSDFRAVAPQPRWDDGDPQCHFFWRKPHVPHASLALCAPGAVILLGRTNMFRFNHPKEAAKLREKRKVRPSVWTPDLLRVRERTTDRTASPSTEWSSVFIKPLHDRSVQVL